MLIDDHVPHFWEPERSGSDTEQRVWEPNWRVWTWILAAVAATAGCFATAGLVSFALLCAAIAFGAQAATHALPYGGGLREHRQ